jgi:archaellum component FlaC
MRMDTISNTDVDAETLTVIKDDIKRIHSKLDKIEAILENHVKPSCDELHNHINFIHKTYDLVKSPLFYITNKIKAIAPKTNAIDYQSYEAVPTIEN